MAVQEIIKNKKYKIDIPLGYSGTKRIRHIETFYGGKKEAVLRENELKLQLKNNTYIKKNKLTIEDLMNEWLESKQNEIELKTYKSYKLWATKIINAIGSIKVKDVNVKILEDFYNELRTTTALAPKSIQDIYTTMSMALNKAIKWGYILNNPNLQIDKPKVKKQEIQCYSPEDVEKMLSVLKNEPLKYQAIITLAIDSGCRRGEITGLTWNDVDFDKSFIVVNKTTQYLPTQGIYEKSTKSETSNRVIYITNSTKQLLKKYQAEQFEKRILLGSKWQNSNRVFTTDYGADMHPDTPSKILEKIIKKYNLKRITFHGLRHTSISLQIASGVQSQIVSKRAGHSSVAVTDKIYSHFFESEFKDVANKMDSFLKLSI